LAVRYTAYDRPDLHSFPTRRSSDLGVPLNLGVFLGAPNVLGTMLDCDELIALFNGELDEKTASSKMTRNVFAYLNSPFIIGLKEDRKSTRLNSSHVSISYAVFCLQK